MEDFVPFGSGAYCAVFGLVAFARGSDIFSTWVATPNLILEGNPLAKKLGWKWGILANILFCLVFSLWPLAAIMISTTSVLVAARNFQHAWLMRSLGEETYRAWHVARIQETRFSLYLCCLVGQTALTGGVGAALICFSLPQQVVPIAIGLGIVSYAIAVAFYTLLSVWRMRRVLG